MCEGWLMFYINTNSNRINTRVLTLEITPQWVTLELGVTPPLLDKNNNWRCLTPTRTLDVYPFLYIAFGLTPSKECKSPEGTTLRDSLHISYRISPINDAIMTILCCIRLLDPMYFISVSLEFYSKVYTSFVFICIIWSAIDQSVLYSW